MSDSDSDSIFGGSSDSLPQDGGAGPQDLYMYIALGVSSCTICITILTLSIIIGKKSNC